MQKGDPERERNVVAFMGVVLSSTIENTSTARTHNVPIFGYCKYLDFFSFHFTQGEFF